MEFKEMRLEYIEKITGMYVETFNSHPWNENWTIKTASKRLKQMINTEDSYGIIAYKDGNICGMILGSEEEFYNGVMFNIKEFCVKNDMRSNGIGTKIFEEFENRLKNKGIHEIILLTSRGEGTEGFYNKRGLKNYNDLIIMGKEL